MKQLILAAAVLTAIGHVQSGNPDYCQINENACLRHRFFLDEYTAGDTFVCLFYPLQWNEKTLMLENHRTLLAQKQHATKKWADTVQECVLPEPMLWAKVTLRSYFHGPMETALIYPQLCFSCDSINLKCRETTTRDDIATIHGGCFIDSFCYPLYALNPADHSQMCYEKQWTDINSIDVVGWTAVPVDTCEVLEMARRGLAYANADRSATPRRVGGEGVDLTGSQQNHFLNPTYMSPVVTKFKFLVKFRPGPAESNEYIINIRDSLSMIRTPENTFIAEINLHNAEMKVYLKSVKLMRNVNEESKVWNLIGISYDIRSGTPSLDLYVNGVRHGPIDSLFLPMNFVLALSKAEFSCIEFNSEADKNFFTSRTFDKCVPSDGALNACDQKLHVWWQ